MRWWRVREIDVGGKCCSEKEEERGEKGENGWVEVKVIVVFM